MTTEPPTGKINHNLRSKSTEQQLSLIGLLKTSANSHVRGNQASSVIDPALYVATSSDGRYIVSGSDWCVKIWNNDKANEQLYRFYKSMVIFL